VRDPDWLREPPPPDESIVYVSVPEGATLTPQITEALTHLSRALLDLDEGIVPPNPCNPFKICDEFWWKNCYHFNSCRIKI
jgi:hypothetical protein